MEVDTVKQSVVMDVDVGKGGDDDVEMKDGEVEMNGGHCVAMARSIGNANESQVAPANDGDVEMKEANVEETEAMEVENIDKDNGEYSAAIEGFDDIDNSLVTNTADSDDVEMSDGRVDSD